ncbi:hypothetical protein PVK06_027862 [Gossypium arboreum]|uniref:Uncharacterized protein n=1 Tax=Gossypium arboreum TaxID=29729 RepID=A0ABR0P1H2_GOSAR|nr:hypothetical protein PVK06_027862 [Gossypium arboreum]
MGYTKAISSVAEKHGKQLFCRYPDDVLTKVECMLLLHSIMIGRKINVGKTIFREVHHCAQKNVGTLNFTSLITTLCQRINVPFQENEDKIPNKGAITKKITMRFSGEKEPRHPGSPSTSSPPTSTHATPSTSHNDFEQ